MKLMSAYRLARLGFGMSICLVLFFLNAPPRCHAALPPLSPSCLAISPDGNDIYVGCATADRVLVVDQTTGEIKRRIETPAPPSGLALNASGSRLIVTASSPQSKVCIYATSDGSLIKTVPSRHSAMSPVLSPDEKTLYICERFNNTVAFIDLKAGEVTHRVRVPREPVSLDITPDGEHLVVANHLHAGRADLAVVASTVTVVSAAEARVVKEIELPNGSGLLRDIRVSPDGKHAAVTHLVSRFHLPTTQIERGWINNNAISLIDLASFTRINTVLLDNIDSGAANPWGLAWTSNGRQLLVTHAGTHELSIIDAPELIDKLHRLAREPEPAGTRDYSLASHTAEDVPNDLSFLVGLRRRIPFDGKGPRSIAVRDSKVWVAHYFSDSLSKLDMSVDPPAPQSVSLGISVEPSMERKGELYFNDADLCFQGWQSCASCHSSDARVDALNWDNLNDGIGNPKNVKSLLLAHRTPPSMALGVRANARVSVRAGIRHALFSVQPDNVAESLDAYLMSLEPIPSPQLEEGKLSDEAKRGKTLFESRSVGCTKCHKPPLFTDQRLHDVGTRGIYDKPTDRFDTPTLIEVWRSAPYLHDGSAATLRDVWHSETLKDEHGTIKDLKPHQLDDLVSYVLSL